MTRYNLEIKPGVYKIFNIRTFDLEVPWDVRERLILAAIKKVGHTDIVWHGFGKARTLWTLHFDVLPRLDTDSVTEKMSIAHLATQSLNRINKKLLKNFGVTI